MIPIACKLTNFFLHLFVSFLKRDYNNYFLAHAQLLISRKPISQIFTHFQPIMQHYKQENSTKSNSTINPAITENMECLIIKAHASFINLKVGVSLNHDVSLCFVSLLNFRTCWATFQAKNNVRSTPGSSALALSHTKAIKRIPQIVAYVEVEKEWGDILGQEIPNLCSTTVLYNLARLVFLHLRYNHACVLKLDTFFLGRDIITILSLKNFLPIVVHKNITKESPNYCSHIHFVKSQIIIDEKAITDMLFILFSIYNGV